MYGFIRDLSGFESLANLTGSVFLRVLGFECVASEASLDLTDDKVSVASCMLSCIHNVGAVIARIGLWAHYIITIIRNPPK